MRRIRPMWSHTLILAGGLILGFAPFVHAGVGESARADCNGDGIDDKLQLDNMKFHLACGESASPHGVYIFGIDGTWTGTRYDQAGLGGDYYGDGTTDGDYIYFGGGQGVYRHALDGSGGTLLFPNPLAYALGAIAYDPSGNAGVGSFWVTYGDYPLVELSRTGQILHEYLPGSAYERWVRGLAYDPADGNLWATSWNSTIIKLSTATGEVLSGEGFSCPVGPRRTGGVEMLPDLTGRMVQLWREEDYFAIEDTFGNIVAGPWASLAQLPPDAVTVLGVAVARQATGDCNSNGIPDDCDIAGGTSTDCNGNGLPDECDFDDLDCNANGWPDECDLASGTSVDCQGDGVPDECQLAGNDCDGNGIPDDCDVLAADCNGNGVPDACDIAGGGSVDCQGDGVPDECQLLDGAVQLTHDDGSTEDSFGLTSGGGIAWIVHYNTGPEPMRITSISTVFGGATPSNAGVSPGDTVHVHVWDDPDGDGHPADAVYLGGGTAAIDAASINTDHMQEIALDAPICVGSGSCFVGASVLQTADAYPGPMDYTGPHAAAGWVSVVFGAPFDPEQMDGDAGLLFLPNIGLPVNWMLRAKMQPCSPPQNDCNENSLPDECDLSSGFSDDVNLNLIPDECELLGDCNFDGQIDASDLAILSECHLGPAVPVGSECDCFDINVDGSVDMQDVTFMQRSVDTTP